MKLQPDLLCSLNTQSVPSPPSSVYSNAVTRQCFNTVSQPKVYHTAQSLALFSELIIQPFFYFLSQKWAANLKIPLPFFSSLSVSS